MLAQLWNQGRALVVTAAVLIIDFVFNLAGLPTDSRMITGAPAWLKPAKFAISSAILAVSISWLFRYLPQFPRTKRWTGNGIAAILALEVGIIDFQAFRGTSSHFNVGTVEDAVLFGIMGSSIGILWLLSVWISVALFRQTFIDSGWGWALRLGMLVSVLGSASGGLMLHANPEQAAALAHHEKVKAIGAHTVGAPDGGPGLQGVGWSKEHGDLRIPHFLGLHALQIIPFAVWLRRRRATTKFAAAIAASYLALYLILVWQALRGESIAEPSLNTMAVLGTWLLATVAAVLWTGNSTAGTRPLNAAATA